MDLKPCPFCGKEAEIERLGTPRQSTIYQCGWCAATLETGEEWGHGTAWNTRPREDALQAEVERLRKLVEHAYHEGWDAAVDEANVMEEGAAGYVSFSSCSGFEWPHSTACIALGEAQ